MKIKIVVWMLVTAGLSWGLFLVWEKNRQRKMQKELIKTVEPFYGSIQKVIASTGTVKPQNRIEIKPPIGGRIDQILVKEGQLVKNGEILALMSSTERAALLDAAKSQSDTSVTYWEEVYRPTPIIAPIDGEVIVRGVQPGQTVTSLDPVIVLSDRLIVQAQVDETDIGRVKEGQHAVITLDAYPHIEVQAVVGHIYYESQLINNVTIYQVDILPETVPDVFRSGMSANVEIVEENKDHALLIPILFVNRDEEGSFVLVRKGKNPKPLKRYIELGLADENNAEILSGAGEKDVLVLEATQWAPAKDSKGASNPFMPFGRRRGNEKRGP